MVAKPFREEFARYADGQASFFIGLKERLRKPVFITIFIEDLLQMTLRLGPRIYFRSRRHTLSIPRTHHPMVMATQQPVNTSSPPGVRNAFRSHRAPLTFNFFCAPAQPRNTTQYAQRRLSIFHRLSTARAGYQHPIHRFSTSPKFPVKSGIFFK